MDYCQCDIAVCFLLEYSKKLFWMVEPCVYLLVQVIAHNALYVCGRVGRRGVVWVCVLVVDLIVYNFVSIGSDLCFCVKIHIMIHVSLPLGSFSSLYGRS